MSLPRALCLVVAFGAACPATGAGAGNGVRILTGSDDAVWLIRPETGQRAFDLAVRKADGDWQWVHKALVGRPARAAATPGRLHVLFAAPVRHVIFERETGDLSTALSPDLPLWPLLAAPAAVCEATDPNHPAAQGVAAVVPRPIGLATTKPATSRAATQVAIATAPAATAGSQPATRPCDLGIFRRIGAEWTHLGDWANVLLASDSRVLAASVEGSIYVLLSRPSGGANRLGRWDGREVREVALDGPAAARPAVGMLAVGGRLVLVLAAPGEDPARRRLLIGTFEPAAGSFSFLPMARGEETATWPADALPDVARLGGQMALVWQEDQALQFGTCVPHVGQLTAKGSIDVFERPPLGGQGEVWMERFVWVVCGAIFLPMFVFRPRGRPEPFALPETLRTGHLGKRLLAALIDLGPIYVFTALVFRLLPLSPSQEEWERMLERLLHGQKVEMPLQVAFMYMAVYMLYAAYGTFLEMRTGTTFGKRVMKLRVAAAGGRRPTLRQCLLRNLVKIIELQSLFSPLFLLVLVIPLFTRYRQRFGDMMARTAVVDARRTTPPEPPPVPPTHPPDESDRPAE